LDRQSSTRWRTPNSNVAGSDTGGAQQPLSRRKIFKGAVGSNYEFSAGLPQPTLSTAAGQTDLLGFIYNARKGSWLLAAFVNGFS
jgi:hypothetical protein